MPKAIFYLNGEYVTLTKAWQDYLTPGQHRLKGVFETLRVERGRAHDVPAHLKRLFSGLKVLKMTRVMPAEQLTAALRKTIRLNRHINCGRLRICVYQEKQRVCCALMLLAYQPLPLGKYAQGLKVMLVKTRRPARPQEANVKSLDYGLFARAHAKAKAKGYDEAILLNERGEVFEASRANVFLWYAGELITPPLSSGCLDGITRRHIIDLARRMKLPVCEKNVTVDMLKKAGAVYLTNSLIGMIKTQCLLAPDGLTHYN